MAEGKQQWHTIIIAQIGKAQTEPPVVLRLEMVGGVSTVITHIRLIGNISVPVVKCELIVQEAQIHIHLRPILIDPSQIEEFLSEMFLVGWRKALIT